MKNEAFVIEGLAGKKTLKGTVRINGAKNAVLPAMAGAVLFSKPVRLENVPKTKDVETMSEIFRKMGASVKWSGEVLEIDTANMKSTAIDPALAGSMRASVMLTGPALARFGKVNFPAPGGCVIGARPIDLFISGYEKMGATTRLDDKACIYEISAASGLKSSEIFFNNITVGGTETLMMAAVLAEGKTILKNCAMEPEITSIAEWLNDCGAHISGAGTPTIEITGTGGKLLESKKPYVTIPDRIETASYLFLGALCAKDLSIENCRPDHLEAVISSLINAGVHIETFKDTIKIVNNTRPNSDFKSFKVQTHEYPGFPTDVQPVAVAFLTQATGSSVVLETIYESRFKYVEDLQKLGAQITVMNSREIEVKGPTSFRAMPGDGNLHAHDIRAGFAVVMAALAGEGSFRVNNIQLIDRGYEKLEERLSSLGAKIKRVSS